MNTSFAFQVAGIAPRDPSFRVADDATKQAFWGAAVAWVREAWTAQMAAGQGADGEDLAEIAASTRKRGRWRSYTGMGSANAPPLTPAYGLSRTRALFDCRAHWREGYVLGFWRADPISGRHWGQVLGWHRDGAGRLPARDVIGLAPAFVARVQAQADAWWAAHRTDRAGLVAGRTTLALGANRPVPDRPRPVVDLRHATLGIGPSDQLLRKAAAEGKLSAPRRAGEGPPRSGRPTPTRPRPAAKPVAPTPPAAPAPPPPPPPPPKTPGTLARAAVQARLDALSLPDASRPSVRNRAIFDLVREHQSATTTTGAFHGMTDPETFHSIEFEGTRYHFAPLPDTFHPGQVNPILSQLRALAGTAPIPAEIARYTRNVYFTGQSSNKDDYWKQRYNDPNHKSAATGGGGNVVIYRNEPISAGLLVHEMGHNWATGVYQSTFPPPLSRYGRAITSGEPPVSDYARNSTAEDFAEATRLFVEDPEKLKQIAPQRYQAIKDLLHGQA